MLKRLPIQNKCIIFVLRGEGEGLQGGHVPHFQNRPNSRLKMTLSGAIFKVLAVIYCLIFVRPFQAIRCSTPLYLLPYKIFWGRTPDPPFNTTLIEI